MATKIIPKFFGKIENRKIRHYDLDALNGYIGSLTEGKEVEIMVKEKFKRRSSGQPDEDANINGYYWGIVVPMVMDEIGEYGEEGQKRVHYFLQIKTGNTMTIKDPETKKEIIVPKGTSDMSGGQFADFCAKCRMWANEFLGIIIPQPNEAEIQR